MKALRIARMTFFLAPVLALAFSFSSDRNATAGMASSVLQQQPQNYVLMAQAQPKAPAQTPQPPAPGKPQAAQPVPGQQPAPVKPEQTSGTPGEQAGKSEAAQPGKPAGGGPVSFYFEDADIFDVTQTVFGDILKANYIIDQRVKGKVTFRTVNPIPRDEVLSVMEVVLRLNGIGFVEEKGLYRILPLSEVSNELVYAQMGKMPKNVAIELFAFKNVNIKDSMSDIENAIGLSSQFGKVRIVPIYRLNAILAVASDKRDLDYVRAWVKAFDTMFADAKPTIMVYPLQNSKAAHVASMLQSIFSGGGGGGGGAAPTLGAPLAPRTAMATPTGGPTLGGPTQALHTGPAATVTGTGFLVSPETKIFADEITNSLVILAIPADYDFIKDTIRKIDTVQRQVVLEALIVRVQLNNNLSFGFSWSFSNSVKISGVKPFKNDINLHGNVTDNPGILPTDSNGNPSPSSTGFTFIGYDPTGHVRAVINALEGESKAKVLAAPHILVSDNREARIQVGSQIPIATSTTTTPLSTVSTTTSTTPSVLNTSTSTIQYKDIGIILKVKPQINDSGLVTLELTQEVSSVGTTPTVIAGQDFTSIDKEEVTSNLIAQDGETIIIGGLIREDSSKSKDGIPFLSKIPIIGNLFGNTSNTSDRSEIIVLLTPHVMRNMEEAEKVTSGYVERYKAGTKDKDIHKFLQEKSEIKPKDENGGAKDSK